MLKETETEETIVFFVTFLSLVAFQLRGGPGPLGPPWLRLCLMELLGDKPKIRYHTAITQTNHATLLVSLSNLYRISANFFGKYWQV